MKSAALAIALMVGAPIGIYAQSGDASADSPTTTAKAKAKVTSGKKAASKKDAAKSKAKKSGAQATAVKPANNANCPVGGAPVGSMQPGSHIIYKGYNVGLCCDGCKAKFNSNPEAYLAKALGR